MEVGRSPSRQNDQASVTERDYKLAGAVQMQDQGLIAQAGCHVRREPGLRGCVQRRLECRKLVNRRRRKKTSSRHRLCSLYDSGTR